MLITFTSLIIFTKVKTLFTTLAICFYIKIIKALLIIANKLEILILFAV